MRQKVYKRNGNNLVANFGLEAGELETLYTEFDKIQEAAEVSVEALEEVILTFLESDASQELKFLYMYKFGSDQGYGEAMAKVNSAIGTNMVPEVPMGKGH